MRCAYPGRRVARDIAEAERVALGLEARDRVLVVAWPGHDSSALVDLAVGLLRGGQQPEIVVAALEAQTSRRLEMGSGLSDELAEMAAGMERQQALVRYGEQRGVPVRVIANPTADVTADLRELSAVIAPQYVVAWTSDQLGRAVAEAAECPVVLAAAHLGEIAAGTPVVVTWTPDADGDAATVIAARFAAELGSGVDLRGSGRRYEGVRATLAERGVRLEPADAAALPISVSALGGPGDVQVRSEVDATPVDWATADVGVASEVGA